jgi:hypothetical protein
MYPPGKQYQRILVYLIFLDVTSTITYTSQQSGVWLVLSASGIRYRARLANRLHVIYFYISGPN